MLSLAAKAGALLVRLADFNARNRMFRPTSTPQQALAAPGWEQKQCSNAYTLLIRAVQ